MIGGQRGGSSLLRRASNQVIAFLRHLKSKDRSTGINTRRHVEVSWASEPRHTSIDPRYTSFDLRYTPSEPRYTSFGPKYTTDRSSPSLSYDSGNPQVYRLPQAPSSAYKVKRKPVGQGRRRNDPGLDAIPENGYFGPKYTFGSSSSSSSYNSGNPQACPLPQVPSPVYRIKRKPVGEGRWRNEPRLEAISEYGATCPRPQGTPRAGPLPPQNQNKLLPPLPAGEPEHRMCPDTVKAVVSWINHNLGDIPYAVAGLSGLTMHGFRHRQPVHVTIVCPRRTRDVMRCWAATKAAGRRDPSQDPEKFGVELRGDPVVRTVRVRYVRDESFQGLAVSTAATPTAAVPGGRESESGGGSGARVLTLPALLDRLARSYMRLHKRDPQTAAQARRTQAQDMVWIVDRLIEAGRVVDHADVPHVLNPLFMEPFDCVHPGARELFALAGLVRGGDDDDVFAGLSGAHSAGSESFAAGAEVGAHAAAPGDTGKLVARPSAASIGTLHSGFLTYLRYTDNHGSRPGPRSAECLNIHQNA